MELDTDTPLNFSQIQYLLLNTIPLRCRAAGRPDYWSAPKVKNFEIIVGPGLGTLKKPKYHYMVVGGLLVQELEPLKDLKAEKGWFFGQN